ncbi:MAG: response regulator, partial [Bdellovibrionota bacterium]
MSHLNEEEIREFHTEANELLDQAEKDLLMLDVTESAGALFNSIFRVFHSLKGGSGMLGLDELQGHMHKLENLLAKMKGNDPALKEQSGFFLSGVDVARKMLNGETAAFDYEPGGKKENAKAPVAEAPPASAKAPAPAKEALPKGQRKNLPLVYIVDDEPMIVDLLKEHLAGVEAEVETFTCPKALLASAQKARPDLILSDMRMPELSGLELAKEVRALDPEIPL